MSSMKINFFAKNINRLMKFYRLFIEITNFEKRYYILIQMFYLFQTLKFLVILNLF